MARTARQRAASKRNLIAARKKRRHRARNIAFATVAVGTIGLGAAHYGPPMVKHYKYNKAGKQFVKSATHPQLALTRGKTNVDTPPAKYAGKRPFGASKLPQKPTRGKRVFKVANDFNHTTTLVKRPRAGYDAGRRSDYVPKPQAAATPTRRQQQIRSQFDTMNGQKLWRNKNVKGILGNQGGK